jgi:hypothetical protein
MHISNLPFRSYLKEDKGVVVKKRYKIPARKNNSTLGLKSTLKTMWGYKSQKEMFAVLWNNHLILNKNIICPYTGEKLNSYYDTILWVNCFAHVLPKGKYPYWRLNPVNIRLVSPAFHRIVDQGRLSDRLDFPEWKWSEWDKLVDQKKKEYEVFIKKYL